MKKTYLYICLLLVAGLLSACAELASTPEIRRPELKEPAGKVRSTGAGEIWQGSLDELNQRGDYEAALAMLRHYYLAEPADAIKAAYANQLVRLDDLGLRDLLVSEDNPELLCLLAAEGFLRLQRRSASGLSVAEEELMADYAARLTGHCAVNEDVRIAAQDFLLLRRLEEPRSEIKIGCLLPLSGANAEAGRRLLRGMEQALRVYEIPEAPAPAPVAASEVAAPASVPGEGASSAGAAENSTESESSLTPSSAPAAASRLTYGPRLKLLLYDTGGEGERARAGVNYLVREQGVSLLLGPYTGKAANYAAVEAQSLACTMISLSPLTRNLELYPNVFLHYPTIANQARSLAELATAGLDLETFALLVPRNPYGREFAEVFQKALGQRGGQVVRQVEYDAARPDFGPAIRELIGNQRYRDFRQARERYEEWSKKQRQREADQEKAASEADKLLALAREIGLEEEGLLEEKEEPRPFLVTDFEAIVIPDREQTLELLIPQLAFYDLDECFLLGGRYWHSRELMAKVKDYADGAFFVDACFAAADKEQDFPDLARMQRDFQRLYPEQEARLLEVLGFDTIRLVQELAAAIDGDHQAESWRQALSECRDLKLASGLTSTLPDGELAKKLYSLTVKNGCILPYKP